MVPACKYGVPKNKRKLQPKPHKYNTKTHKKQTY